MNMKFYKVSRIFFLLLGLSIGGNVLAQDTGKKKSVKKQKQEFLDLQEKRDKDSAGEMEKKKAKHREIQSKSTQKRMKKNEKKSKRVKAGKHKDTWFERTFRKKPKR